MPTVHALLFGRSWRYLPQIHLCQQPQSIQHSRPVWVGKGGINHVLTMSDSQLPKMVYMLKMFTPAVFR